MPRTKVGTVHKTNERRKQAMLARQRQTAILTEVARRGSARVRDLRNLLNASAATVGRDLEALAVRGLIERVHGGAVALPKCHTTDAASYVTNPAPESPETDAIAAHAAALVRPYATIAIAPGTTAAALARHLVDVPGLTIVTNSIPVARVFDRVRRDQTVVLIGGIRTRSDALVGPVAVAAAAATYVDVVFVDVHGMEASLGFSAADIMEAEVNRAVIANARRRVFMAGHALWGLVGLRCIASLSEAHVLVTDHRLKNDARGVLSERVGKLLVAPASPARSRM
jgi:DeoR/GlpR family transcriptional regulator of sugar metabolism